MTNCRGFTTEDSVVGTGVVAFQFDNSECSGDPIAVQLVIARTIVRGIVGCFCSQQSLAFV